MINTREEFIGMLRKVAVDVPYDGSFYSIGSIADRRYKEYFYYSGVEFILRDSDNIYMSVVNGMTFGRELDIDCPYKYLLGRKQLKPILWGRSKRDENVGHILEIVKIQKVINELRGC